MYMDNVTSRNARKHDVVRFRGDHERVRCTALLNAPDGSLFSRDYQACVRILLTSWWFRTLHVSLLDLR